IHGDWTAFVYSKDSDQFLNFWMNRGGVWSFTGNLFKMTKGGHIKIEGTDFSGYEPASENYLFRLEGASHALAVCAFTCKDARFELKTEHAKVMYSEWPQGIITFDSVDMSSQATQSYSSTFVPFYFNYLNVAGPLVAFRNCSLMGKHQFRAASNDFETR